MSKLHVGIILPYIDIREHSLLSTQSTACVTFNLLFPSCYLMYM